jgi:hypothetical protein
MLCPKCKVDSGSRSRRTGLPERLLGIVGYYPYRCQSCSHRFRSFGYSPPVRSKPSTAAERDIASCQGASRGKQIRREVWLYTSAFTLFVILLYYLTRAPAVGD